MIQFNIWRVTFLNVFLPLKTIGVDLRFSCKRRFTSVHWDDTELSNPTMMCLHIPGNIFDVTVFKIIVVSKLQQHRLMSITVVETMKWRRCRSFVVFCMPFRILTCTHVPHDFARTATTTTTTISISIAAAFAPITSIIAATTVLLLQLLLQKQQRLLLLVWQGYIAIIIIITIIVIIIFISIDNKKRQNHRHQQYFHSYFHIKPKM